MAPARWFARALVAAAALAGVAALAAPASAQEGWELCNDTSFILEAATGRPEGRGVIVEGWTRLRPGECRTAMDPPLKTGVNFVFARSSAAHRGGQRHWNGDFPLCVDPAGSFAVESPSSCPSMGLETRGFMPVKIDDREGWRTRFTETETFSRPGQSARSAGLQRLLNDAGIPVGDRSDAIAVDGYLGREPRRAISAFLAGRSLPAATSDADVIDLLEDVARARSLQVGLTLCNRTDEQVWAAIARREGEEWESRGWWTLESGACARAIDEPLPDAPHYIFAEMETPDGVRRLTGAREPFCVSRVKFAIAGRDNCEGRAYRESAFLQTPIPAEGKLIVEVFDRSFGKPEPEAEP
jgi:uncharacterized membrane protein